MIDYKTIRNTIVSRLYKHLQKPVVPAEQTVHKPPYPYMTYHFMSLYISEGGQKAIYNKALETAHVEQTFVEQPQLTISLTAISDDSLSAQEIAAMARDWFTVIGYDELAELNMVVVEASNVQERSTFIVDDYEVKYGFDVRLRVLDTSEMTVNSIETVNISRNK